MYFNMISINLDYTDLTYSKQTNKVSIILNK